MFFFPNQIYYLFRIVSGQSQTKVLTHMLMTLHTKDTLKVLPIFISISQSAGVVEYSDCISTEG